MPCNCRGSGPGVVVLGAAGVNVDGSGTMSDPFVLTSTIADALVIEARDSATVNLTLTGSGTEEDPYVLRADTGAASRLSALADVMDAAGPQAGEVPTWVAASGSTPGHFEFKLPPVATTTTTTGGGGGGGGGTTTTTTGSTPASTLTGEIPDANLPARLNQRGLEIPVGGDWNTILASGFYRGTQILHAPAGDTSWWYVEVIGHNLTGYAYQRASSFFPGQAGIVGSGALYATYERRLNNGTWSPWQRLYTDADIAAGAIDSRYPALTGSNNIPQTMLPYAEQSGNNTMTINGSTSGYVGGGYQDIETVTFTPGRFATAPHVVVGWESNVPGAMWVGIVPGSITTTGFQLYGWSALTRSSVKCHWNARISRGSGAGG